MGKASSRYIAACSKSPNDPRVARYPELADRLAPVVFHSAPEAPVLTDRYDNPLTTTSEAARDAYVEGCDLVLTQWPGAVAAFDRALASDPDFALAYAGRARALQMASDMPAARAAIAAAKAFGNIPERNASHIEVFNLMLGGTPDAALHLVRRHLSTWPRDAFIAAIAANQNGLIGMSGRAGREQDQLDFLAALAPHYGDDWWFNSHYAMALSELGHRAEARPRIERSIAAQPRNAYAAHSLTHLFYENDDADAAIAFLGLWLANYPRDGGLHGHLSWHLALVHLSQGRAEEGLRLFDEAFGADDYQGPLLVKMLDAPSFLWRAELAGHPRDTDRWQKVHDFAHRAFPNPGVAFVDWHIALADAVAGDDIEQRTRQIETLAESGRYPAGPTVPAAARGFAAFQRGDYATAIKALESMIGERERMAGSRAQLDLVEFTLLKSYLASGRIADARRLVAARRPGPRTIPVASVEITSRH
jgi:tetratricopeptide (TPR) repeat protein